jgi:hypothetical protein
VASRRAHTTTNQERPLATLVPDPEKIIRSGKVVQRQTLRSARASRPGISRNTHLDQVFQETLIHLFLENLLSNPLMLKLLVLRKL